VRGLDEHKMGVQEHADSQQKSLIRNYVSNAVLSETGCYAFFFSLLLQISFLEMK